MEYILKPFTNNDTEFIYEVKKNAYYNYVVANYGEWDEGTQRRYFSDYIKHSKQDIEMIVVNGTRVGFYQGENLEDGSYEIVNICVIPKYQNKGIGTQILKDKILKHSNQNIKIQYFKQNPVGKLYEKLGFKPDGATKTHFQMIKKTGVTPTEIAKVQTLTGIDPREIKFSDDGFLSRGYVIDDGRIVFKFKKSSEVDYDNEAKMLDFINSLDLGVNLQKVGWRAGNGEYLGIYGVIGKSLEKISLSDSECRDYGQQLGKFLKKLHKANFASAAKCSVNEEISAWQERFNKSKSVLAQFFSEAEIVQMKDFITRVVPEKLLSLGEKLVFSHGDLGEGNIFVDKTGKIGVIDFSESGYFDEAADFMDVLDDRLCEEMLNAYKADDELREKVAIRRAVRSMFVIGTYASRPAEEINKYVEKIRRWQLNESNYEIM